MSASGIVVSCGLRAVAWLTALLPWRSLRVLGAVLGWLAGTVLRIRREVVVGAMRRAGIARADAVASAMYSGLGAGIFELFWLAGASAERRERAVARVVIDDATRSALRSALARGPVVFGASHTSNWELAAFAAARLLADEGRALAVVAKPLSVGAFDAFCTQLRESFGVRMLSPDGALGSARQALADGSVVVMPIDQVPDRTRHGDTTSFLGAPALVDRAPASLTRAVGGTLIVVGVERDSSGRAGDRHRVRFLASFEAPASGEERREFVAKTTVGASAALEAFIQERPADWLWLHRRWRAPREVRRVGPVRDRPRAPVQETSPIPTRAS